MNVVINYIFNKDSDYHVPLKERCNAETTATSKFLWQDRSEKIRPDHSRLLRALEKDWNYKQKRRLQSNVRI